MDPQCTLKILLTAYQAQDWHIVKESAEALQHWLLLGGFPPQLNALDEDQVRLVVQMVCSRALLSAPDD